MKNDDKLAPSLPKKPAELKRNLSILLFLSIIYASGSFTNFSLSELLGNLGEAGDLLGRMFLPPDFSYARRLFLPMVETLQISFLGTVIGSIFAIPMAVLAARNITTNKFLGGVFRMLLNLFRTIPALVFAALFTSIFGFGSFSGMLALFVFTLGLVAKLTYEAIEGIDHGPLEALRASGAGHLAAFFYAVVPQVLPQYLSYVLYSFEINIRASAVLGYVGAGGIAEYYDRTLSYLKYDRAGTIVLLTFVVILSIDLISARLREKLL
ncbi:MAG TPA: phosphonate ABC transporter, permease protein PhnE [Clostridia bacterium]|nr:phosphonate ABC transporter, permease protein PhnE [Clostridia bacterium]